MKIYVASSWKNSYQAEVVARLRAEGHEVYDFKNPAPDDTGFGWKQTHPDIASVTPAQFRDEVLTHPIARHGFDNDMNALRTADCTVLVQKRGNSAHLELGYAVGASQFTVVLLQPGCEPELMYKMCDALCVSLDEVCERIAHKEVRRGK